MQHRIQVSSTHRQRLIKILHSSRTIDFQHRLRLYCACARSSTAYGVHAVGFTSKSLNRLQQYEIQHFRAIARSPVHLTREPNDVFLRRQPIQEYFRKLLQGRIKKCQNESIQQHFAKVLNFLTQEVSQDTEMGDRSEVLLPIAQNAGVSCPTCGMYFLDQSSMRKHHAKKHKISLVNPAGKDYKKRKELDVTCAMVDGMPECAYCGKRFDRFSGLRAHLLSTCEKIPRAPSKEVQQEAATLLQKPAVSKVEEEEGAGALHGQTRREHQSPLSMIKRPEVVNMLLSSTWRILLDQKSILQELKNFCAICGQWFSEKGPLKTQYRRMHDEAWSRKSDAIARCAQAGLSKTSPCAYCGACFRTPGAHNKQVLQCSLSGLNSWIAHLSGPWRKCLPQRMPRRTQSWQLWNRPERQDEAGVGERPGQSGQVPSWLFKRNSGPAGKGPAGLDRQQGLVEFLAKKRLAKRLDSEGGGRRVKGDGQGSDEACSQARRREQPSSLRDGIYALFGHRQQRHHGGSARSFQQVEGTSSHQSGDKQPEGDLKSVNPQRADLPPRWQSARTRSGTRWVGASGRPAPGSSLDLPGVEPSKKGRRDCEEGPAETLGGFGSPDPAPDPSATGNGLDSAPSNKAHGPVVPIGGPALPHVHRTSAVGRSFGSTIDRPEAEAGETSTPANGKGVGGDLPEIPDLRLGTQEETETTADSTMEPNQEESG